MFDYPVLSVIYKIFNARYAIDVEKIFQYIEQKKIKLAGDILLQRFLSLLDKPQIENKYILPRSILKNNGYIRRCVKQDVLKMLASKDLKTVKTYFITNHEFIKYSLNQWFLLNSGILLEFVTIPKNISTGFKKWLKQYSVGPGDEVVYRHTISENGRTRLLKIGFPVRYKHWAKEYTADALVQIARILQHNPSIKGIWNEGSWLYDPAIHQIASDGKPFVAFNFFKNNLFTGDRFYLGIAQKKKKFYKQFKFATRNSRRLNLAKKGEFIPKVYGAFYDKCVLINNVPTLKKYLQN